MPFPRSATSLRVEGLRGLRFKTRFGIPDARRIVRRGSVLDPDFMSTVEPADIVYSWGVLHHTGRIWDAIVAAAAKIPGGRCGPDHRRSKNSKGAKPGRATNRGSVASESASAPSRVSPGGSDAGHKTMTR